MVPHLFLGYFFRQVDTGTSSDWDAAQGSSSRPAQTMTAFIMEGRALQVRRILDRQHPPGEAAFHCVTSRLTVIKEMDIPAFPQPDRHKATLSILLRPSDTSASILFIRTI